MPTVKCPKCSQQYKIGQSLSGKVIQCKTCAKKFRLPAFKVQAKPAEPKASAAQSPSPQKPAQPPAQEAMPQFSPMEQASDPVSQTDPFFDMQLSDDAMGQDDVFDSMLGQDELAGDEDPLAAPPARSRKKAAAKKGGGFEDIKKGLIARGTALLVFVVCVGATYAQYAYAQEEGKYYPIALYLFAGLGAVAIPGMIFPVFSDDEDDEDDTPLYQSVIFGIALLVGLGIALFVHLHILGFF